MFKVGDIIVHQSFRKSNVPPSWTGEVVRVEGRFAFVIWSDIPQDGESRTTMQELMNEYEVAKGFSRRVRPVKKECNYKKGKMK